MSVDWPADRQRAQHASPDAITRATPNKCAAWTGTRSIATPKRATKASTQDNATAKDTANTSARGNAIAEGTARVKRASYRSVP